MGDSIAMVKLNMNKPINAIRISLKVTVCSIALPMIMAKLSIKVSFAFHFGNAWEENDGTIHFGASINDNFKVMDELSAILSGTAKNLDQNSPHSTVHFKV